MGAALSRCGCDGAPDSLPQRPSPTPPRLRPRAPASPYVVVRLERPSPAGSTRELLRAHVRRKLSSGAGAAISLPAGADRGMWVDIHFCDFANELALLYDLIQAPCGQNCGQMAAGTRRFYAWEDGEVLSAHDYCRRVLTEAAALVENDAVFPRREGEAYPPRFWKAMKVAFRRLLRVYAHLYHAHFSRFVQLRYQNDVNELFRRFLLFSVEFDLVETREFEPLSELVSHLVAPQPRAPGSLGESFDSLAYSQSSPRSPSGKTARDRGAPQPPDSLFGGRNLSQDLDREDALKPQTDDEYGSDDDDDAETKEAEPKARQTYVT
ncbi:Mob1/phocein [Pelagophyceae sp. CCMP2097]|nr:Mob1/phocein [Pelagophyceae sp. CCMP2097]